MEDTLFFKTIPNPQPNADVIAKVSLSDVNRGTATAKLIEVLKTSDARVHQGDKIPMTYRFTSCGPNHINGDEGTIIAKIGTDSGGRLVLFPYMRRYMDGHLTLPSMSN